MVKIAGILMALVVSGVGIAFASAEGMNLASNPGPVASSSTSYTTTSTIPGSGFDGTLIAKMSIGPTQPVCTVQPADQPPPSYFSSVQAAVTDSSGRQTLYSLSWNWNGCYATSSLTLSLSPGSYSLNLTNCTWMGCRSALPRDFGIISGRSTEVDISVFTGIA